MFIAIIVMSMMGILFGLGLALASKIFRVEVDPKMEEVLAVLPGSNCGACGKAACAALAEAIAAGDMSLTSCPAGGEEISNKLAEILGVEKSSVAKKIARVRCGGGKNAKDKYIYQGVRTCRGAALMAGGQKLCSFGCLGFGDCVAACPFDAIHMGEEGVPVIDADKCISCGKCAEACPKNIISLGHILERYYVKCMSQDKVAFVKKACKTGCIGCKICEKLSKGAFVIENNLSRLDYGKVNDATPLKLCVEKCPTKCIKQL